MSHQQPGTTPHPQQPQGWNGGSPQGGSAGAQPGYGFPQQPPAPPQTYGQQPPVPGQPAPYGQQPPIPGQPAPYGQQPPIPGQAAPYGQQLPYGQGPSNGSGGSGKKTALIVAAAVAALALLGGGIYFVTAGGDDEGPDSSAGAGRDNGAAAAADPTAYKLTLPGKLAEGGGEYVLNPIGKVVDKKANPDIVADGLTVQGKYISEKNGKKMFALIGVYGSIKDPEATVDTLVGGMNSQLGGGALVTQEPSGFDGDVMKCGSASEGDESVVYCGWGDAGTVGNLMWTGGPGAAVPSLAEFAGTTARIRDEVRVEK